MQTTINHHEEENSLESKDDVAQNLRKDWPTRKRIDLRVGPNLL